MRGMATLSLRMERASATALALAEQLAGHRTITAVHYPGLTERTDHQLATRQLATGIGNPGYGNMLTIELAGGYDAAERFIRGRYSRDSVLPFLGRTHDHAQPPRDDQSSGNEPRATPCGGHYRGYHPTIDRY